MPAEIADPVPERDSAQRRVCRAGARRSPTRISRRLGSDVDELNAFRSPAQQRLIFEEFLLFQAGLVLRKRQQAADHKPHPVVVDDRIRESAPQGAAVPADGRTEGGAA